MKTATILLGLGIVGLGTLGVVTLSKKAVAKPGTQPGTQPTPQGPGAIPTPLPPPAPAPTPGVPSGGGGLVFADDATTIHLRQDQYYRGRALLGDTGLAGLPPFNASASEETIGKGLVALGFVDVRVYMNVAALPSDWPREMAMNALPGTRWFQGQWSGITANVPKPPQVEKVWVTASPGLVAARAAQAIAVSGIGSVMSG